jgi:hypothetical protein
MMQQIFLSAYLEHSAKTDNILMLALEACWQNIVLRNGSVLFVRATRGRWDMVESKKLRAKL